MANWTNPTVNSNYVTFVDEVKNRDVDAALMFDGTGTNLPNLTIRWNQSNSRFERLQDGTWQARILAVSGGGTGAATPSGARSALGLGLMAQQAPDAVSITGGSITGVSFSGTGTLSGNASTASTWQTARTLQIGRTGKSVNGGANVTWTQAEIGDQAASARTLVVRDSNADIHCRLLRSNYQNQTSITAGSAIAYRVSTTDNYIRFSTNMTAVRNHIGANNASNLTSGTVPDARFQETITLNLNSGAFEGTNGTLVLVKIGRQVTLYAPNNLSHASGSLASTGAGAIPPGWRPMAHGVGTWPSNVYNFDSNYVHLVQVTSSGSFRISHRTWAGSSAALSFAPAPMLSWITD